SGDELPERLFLLRPEQLHVAHSVERISWVSRPDGSLGCGLSGWAFLRKVDLAGIDTDVEILVRGVESGIERAFAARVGVPPSFPPPVEDGGCDYTGGTFAVELPVSELAQCRAEETWDLFVRVSAAGFTVTEPMTRLLRKGSPGGVPAGRL